jgi:hypothetical protein
VTELPEFLVNYFEQRQTARADAVTAFLASLTDRESALVQDAAVMGYVRGSMHPQGEEIPLNKEILAEVIDACFAFPDLYPAFHADLAPHPPTSTWTFEASYAPGKWHGIGPTFPDNVYERAYDKALEYFRRHAKPDKEHSAFRMLRADTVYTVVAEHDLEEQE